MYMYQGQRLTIYVEGQQQERRASVDDEKTKYNKKNRRTRSIIIKQQLVQKITYIALIQSSAYIQEHNRRDED